MPCPLEAAIVTVWPCKTGEQPQGAVTAPAGRNGDAIEWPAVGAHQRQHLGLSPAGVLLHDASGRFKVRDDAAAFAAGIGIVFHDCIPSCTASITSFINE
jgi:hypothetical protein